MVYYVSMGLFDRFLTNQTIAPTVDVAAANTPYNLQAAVGGLFYGAQTATREQAMSVPSVARARNIICKPNLVVCVVVCCPFTLTTSSSDTEKSYTSM